MADDLFRGKYLQLSALVAGTKEGPGGRNLGQLRGGSGGAVHCLIGRERVSELAGVVAGRFVIIRGRCDGKQGANVVLRDCSIVAK